MVRTNVSISINFRVCCEDIHFRNLPGIIGQYRDPLTVMEEEGWIYEQRNADI